MIALVQIEIWITNSAVTFPISKSNRLTTTFPSFSRHGPPSCPLLSLLYFHHTQTSLTFQARISRIPNRDTTEVFPTPRYYQYFDVTHTRSVSLIWDAKRLVLTNFLSVCILFRMSTSSFPLKHSKRVESVRISIWPRLVVRMLST
jgi:hypothetical protein